MKQSNLFTELPKGSISEIIIKRITDALISGELKPGDKIPTELEFSEKLGVSRNAVREAVKVLVAFGVLQIRRSDGTYVVDQYNRRLLDPMIYGLILSVHSMEELLETKIALSSAILYTAIGKVTPEEIIRLGKIGEAFKQEMSKKAVDMERAYQTAKQFNLYLGEICNNEMLIQLDGTIHEIATFTRRKAIEQSIVMGKPQCLPDNYLKEVEILKSGKKEKIPAFMDERKQLWEELVNQA